MRLFQFQSPLGIVLMLLHIKGLKLLFGGLSYHLTVHMINKPFIVIAFHSFYSERAQLFWEP